MISDTHNKHGDLTIPDGDMIIHAGDFTSAGTIKEIRDFIYWYSKLPHKYKILIAGNHDWGMDGDNQKGWDHFHNRRYGLAGGGRDSVKVIEEEAAVLMAKLGITYLKSSGIEIEGIKIWGSPVQPEFCGWAFNKYRGEDIKKEWNKIPDDTNILITHGPPHGIKDKCQDGFRAGCEELYKKISKMPDLKLHIFGHIHEDRGIAKVFNTTYVNASSLTLRYQPQKEHTFVLNYEDL